MSKSASALLEKAYWRTTKIIALARAIAWASDRGDLQLADFGEIETLAAMVAKKSGKIAGLLDTPASDTTDSEWAGNANRFAAVSRLAAAVEGLSRDIERGADCEFIDKIAPAAASTGRLARAVGEIADEMLELCDASYIDPRAPVRPGAADWPGAADMGAGETDVSRLPDVAAREGGPQEAAPVRSTQHAGAGRLFDLYRFGVHMRALQSAVENLSDCPMDRIDIRAVQGVGRLAQTVAEISRAIVGNADHADAAASPPPPAGAGLTAPEFDDVAGRFDAALAALEGVDDSAPEWEGLFVAAGDIAEEISRLPATQSSVLLKARAAAWIMSGMDAGATVLHEEAATIERLAWQVTEFVAAGTVPRALSAAARPGARARDMAGAER